MGLIDFLRRYQKEQQVRRLEEEKERSQLNYRFPLNSLPDELIEVIFRLIITNHGMDVFKKLLQNVPDLRSKVLLVSDTDIGDSYLPLLSTSEDVPRTDVKSYELSLTQPSQKRPLIVFFTFLKYHMESSEMLTTLTRFIEDGPYVHLLTHKCIILTEDPFPDRGSQFPPVHNPLNYLDSIIALTGAQVMELKTNYLNYSRSYEETPIIINLQEIYLMESVHRSLTFDTNSEINRAINGAEPLTSASKVYICNLHTEMRYGQDRSGSMVRWRNPSSVRLRELRIQMDNNCTPVPGREGECAERLIELGVTTGFDNLHIEYLCPKLPLIVDNSLKLIQDGWFTARNLIIDNLNWSYKNPYGEVCELHADMAGLDQHSWSPSERHPEDDRIRIRCNLMMLIGITDRFLEYSRWAVVRVLYWKRLEPSRKVSNYYERHPAVIHCPSLTLMKVFSIVRNKNNERAHFPQFNTPQLEQLVLVSLKDSEQCWNVKRLLNNQWPETLRRLTVSAHHMCQGPVLEVPLESLPPRSIALSHLSIQRMIPDLNGLDNVTFRELRYLEIDITVIPPTMVASKNHELRINILIEEFKFPAVKTLILSVPHKANETHNFAIPANVEIPKSCDTVGVASMLVHSTVKVNGTPIEFPIGFNAFPRREVFAAFIRDGEGQYVYGKNLMAEKGRPLDTCLDCQWESFDVERRPIDPDI